MKESLPIQRVAVLGAGVMGAQIAAHCVNAGFETRLYDLPDSGKKPHALVNKAIANLTKLKPSPLATPLTAHLLKACTYADDLSELSQCDIIIEAIAERLDWKQALYEQIAPHLSDKCILVSNTSGLSIDTLADVLPETIVHQFCGVHFFNPPRYMHLAELIPSKHTNPVLLDKLETWLTRYLGKGVVRAKDTPNFIANRIGVFSLLATVHHADRFEIGLDDVDALTGVLIGRPKSATFRTMDVVGLDTMARVVRTMQDQLADDPWHPLFALPDWLTKLVSAGHLGQKSGAGIYRKQGKTIEVLDTKSGEYRAAEGKVSGAVLQIMQIKEPNALMTQLFASSDNQAQFLSACFRDLFHYTAYQLSHIAHSVRDVDLALRWGFGWQQGPFETWQASGLASVLHQIKEGIQQEKTLAQAPLPEWFQNVEAFYCEKGAYSPADAFYVKKSELPVYERQIFPERTLGEKQATFTTLYENAGIRLWQLADAVGVISFKTKANTIGQDVLDGMQAALDIAESSLQGVIIYQDDANNFSSGADLRAVATLIKDKQFAALGNMISDFQRVAMRLKYSPIPIVAAVRGRALGGGCELMMHSAAIVAAFESYPGLVELGVGVIPAGGGCKEMAERAAKKAENAELMRFIKPYFEQIATAVVCGSAPDALKRGYLKASDTWLMHRDEVLFAALAKVTELQALNYTPPISQLFPVAGREGHAQLRIGLVNWLEGGFISKTDYFLADQLASVLCGGDVNQGTMVDEHWMLKRELEAFVSLAETPETQARIQHLLETGKPLRN